MLPYILKGPDTSSKSFEDPLPQNISGPYIKWR